MRVSEIMRKAIVIDHDTTLKNATKIMADRDIGSLIVLRGKKLAGIITERDILRNFGRLNEKVFKIMSKNMITVNENESIDNAIAVMAEHRIKRLPVLSEGEIVGIITATDIMAHSDSINQNFLLD